MQCNDLLSETIKQLFNTLQEEEGRCNESQQRFMAALAAGISASVASTIAFYQFKNQFGNDENVRNKHEDVYSKIIRGMQKGENEQKTEDEKLKSNKVEVFDLDASEVADIVSRVEHDFRFLKKMSGRIHSTFGKSIKFIQEGEKYSNTYQFDIRTLQDYIEKNGKKSVFSSDKPLIATGIPYANGVKNAWEKLLLLDDIVNNRVGKVIIDGSNLSYCKQEEGGNKNPKFIGIYPTVEVVRLLKEKYKIREIVVVLDANYTKKMKKNGFEHDNRNKLKEFIAQNGGKTIFASNRNEADKNILMLAMESIFSGAMPRVITNDRMLEHIHAHDYKKDLSQLIQWHIKHNGEDDKSINSQALTGRATRVLEALMEKKGHVSIKKIMHYLDSVDLLIELTKDKKVSAELQQALKTDMINLIVAYNRVDKQGVEDIVDMLYGPVVRALNRLPAIIKKNVVYDIKCHKPDVEKGDLVKLLSARPSCTVLNFVIDFLRIGFDIDESSIYIQAFDERLIF